MKLILYFIMIYLTYFDKISSILIMTISTVLLPTGKPK